MDAKKPFATTTKQVNILKQRNMIISEDKFVEDTLLYNNYYNVINSCAKFFLCDEKDTFKKGTNFQEVVAIYEFEHLFRQTVLSYILEIERHFASVVSHLFSQQYLKESEPHLNPTNLRPDYMQKSYMQSTLRKRKVSKDIELYNDIIAKHENAAGKNSIKHYKGKYGIVPMWVLCNSMSFGNMINFFKSMKDADQNKIAKAFDGIVTKNISNKSVRLDAAMLMVFLDNLVMARNAVAHNGRLFDNSSFQGIKYFQPLHDCFEINKNDDRKGIYNVLLLFLCFLPKHMFIKMTNDIHEHFETLSQKLFTIDLQPLYDSLFFPFDWYSKISKI